MKSLIINPGSTSTKIAIYNDKNILFQENVKHDPDKIKLCKNFIEEVPLRKGAIIESIEKKGYKLFDIDIIVSRGGPLKPLKAGIYEIKEDMVNDIKNGNYQTAHASLVGALIAYEFSKEINKKAIIVDPISTDEMWDFAKITGHPDIKLQALTHTLNSRACGRKIAEKLAKSFFESSFIVAHLGGGISVNALKNGTIVDVSESRQTGPFSPTSCGDLPIKQFIKWLKNSNYPLDKVDDLFNKNGGLLMYFNTDDVKYLIDNMENDPKIKIVIKAMIYRIVKNICSMLPAVDMNPDAIIITGGLAHSEYIINEIRKWLKDKFRIEVVAGEYEIEALAFGAYRAFYGEEKILNYSDF